MNLTIEQNIRNKMKEMLSECEEKHRAFFKRMYDSKGKHSDPVDAVPIDKLDWAFSQIERTLKKLRGEA